MARLPDPDVRARWTQLIQRFEASDLTIAKFCAQNGITANSFYQWRRKLRTKPERPGEFLAVEVDDARGRRDVRIRFPGGAQIEIDAGDTKSLKLIVDRLSVNPDDPISRSGPSQ